MIRKLGVILAVALIVVGLLLPASIAEAYTRYEYYITGADDNWGAAGIVKLAQTFTPTINHTIRQVVIEVARVESPGTVIVSITATNGSGTPTGNDLCNTTFNGDDLVNWNIFPPHNYEWKTVVFDNSTDLVVNTTYAIVLTVPNVTGNDEVMWHMDSSSPTYVGGEGMDWVGWWDDTYDIDFMFEEWGMTEPPTITTSNATYISRTSARLNSYLVDDGGEACDVRFQYDTTAGGSSSTDENFTTYNETDPNNRIAVVATKIDADLTRNEDAYVYIDKGADYFSNFTHNLTVTPQSATANDAAVDVWVLANTIDDTKGILDANGTAIYVWFTQNAAGERRIALRESYSGSGYTDYYQHFTYTTSYYLTMIKNGTSLDCEIYPNATRVTPTDTLTLTLQADHKFRYVYACSTHNSGETAFMDIDIEDLHLGEAGEYTTNTTWVNDTYNTGDSPYADITNLTVNTTYYFRVQATNSIGMTNGSELSFTTYPTINEPTNFTAYPDSTSISLTWTKGVGAAYTMIRQQAGAYPANYTDGKQVYAGAMATALDSSLTPGTTYYYRSWSYDGGGYTANYTDILMTTTAYTNVTQDTPATPTTPSSWWGIPDYTNMENLAGYGIVNTLADNFKIPRNTFWMSGILIMIMCIGLFIYSVQHNVTVALVLTSAMIVVASIAGLLPLFMIAIIAIPMGGIMVIKRRV